MHAAAVARVLQDTGEVVLEGVGGSEMAAAGVRLLERTERLSAVGLLESARALPAHLGLLRRLSRRFAETPCDLAILVDYPGFHLRVADAAAAHRVPVLYYIPPQVWAWGEWRLRALRSRVRAAAVILPFEESYFNGRGVRATFVGHPLLDRPAPPSRDAARRAVGIEPGAPVLGLFPGSRAVEIVRMWPGMWEAARLLQADIPELRVVVAAMPKHSYPGADEFTRWTSGASTVMAAADAGICKSGTTTLEAALAGMPMIVTYRLNPVTAALARRMVRISKIGLINLVAGRALAPEYLQGAATPRELARAVRPLLDPEGAPARAQRSSFAAVRDALGSPGAASRVAELASELAA